MKRTLDYRLSLSIAAWLIGVVLPSAAVAQSRTIAVEAGPIWSHADAEKKCPEISERNGGVWTGEWRTTVPGRMSVCDVRLGRSNRSPITEPIEAGPIWSNADAAKKCDEVAKRNGGIWNGQWRTTVPGRMSVCEIRLPRWRG